MASIVRTPPLLAVKNGRFVLALLIDRLLRLFKEKTLIKSCLLLCVAILLLMLLSGDFWHVLILILLFFSVNAILRLSINTLLSKMAGNEQGFVAGANNAYGAW